MTPRWASWLKVAIGIGLTPADFWTLGLREWLAIASPADQPAMTADQMMRLAEAYPDTDNQT